MDINEKEKEIRKNQKNEFGKLMNRVWKTWHARIKLANRLNDFSKKIEFMSALYSIAISIMTIFTITDTGSNNPFYVYMTSVLSFIVTGLVFYGNTMNLKDRYILAKDNYIKLNELYYILVDEYNKEDYSNFLKHTNSYNKYLKECENHTTNDYIEACLEDPESKGKINTFQINIYFIKKLLKQTLVGLVILFPIILVVLSILLVLK